MTDILIMFLSYKMTQKRNSLQGFTLAELLVALAILGVIATFTIPKILESTSTNTYNATAKEAAAAVAVAYRLYKLEEGATTATTFNDFSHYINYALEDSSGTAVDYYQTQGGANTCTASRKCLIMHNGAYLKGTSQSFAGTGVTNGIRFYVDPDGQYDTDANGPAKSVAFYLYYNGRLSTFGTIANNTCNSAGCVWPNPALDPPWFSWNQ